MLETTFIPIGGFLLIKGGLYVIRDMGSWTMYKNTKALLIVSFTRFNHSLQGTVNPKVLPTSILLLTCIACL